MISVTEENFIKNILDGIKLYKPRSCSMGSIINNMLRKKIREELREISNLVYYYHNSVNTKLNLNKTYSKDSKPSNRDISGSIYIDRRGSMKMGSWNPKDIKLTSSVNKKLSLV